MSRRPVVGVLALAAIAALTACGAAASGDGTVVAASASAAASPTHRPALPAATTPAVPTPVVTTPAVTTPPRPAAPATRAVAPAPTTPAAAPSTAPPSPGNPVGDDGDGYVPVGPSLAHWAGTWERHGETITLDAYGHGTMVFRAGVWCYQNPTPPCDSVVDNEIIDGGYATFHLSYVNQDQPEASGYMDSTTEPVPLRPVAVADNQGPDPADPNRPMSIGVTGLDASEQVYCSSDYPHASDACGA